MLPSTMTWAAETPAFSQMVFSAMCRVSTAKSPFAIRGIGSTGHRMAAQAGLEGEVLIGQDLFQLAFVTGGAGADRLRIGELHRVRHVHVVHQPRLVGVLGLLFRRQIVAIKDLGPTLRIIHCDLPVFMAAVAVVEVADLTRVEVLTASRTDVAADVTVFVVRRRVAIFTAGGVCGRDVINGAQDLVPGKRESAEADVCAGGYIDDLILAIHHNDAVGRGKIAECGLGIHVRAGVGTGVVGDGTLQADSITGAVTVEVSSPAIRWARVRVLAVVDIQAVSAAVRVCAQQRGAVEVGAVLGHIERHGVIGAVIAVRHVRDLDDVLVEQLVILLLMSHTIPCHLTIVTVDCRSPAPRLVNSTSHSCWVPVKPLSTAIS